MKAGRNDPCPCGSGKKFKKCCQGKSELSPPEPTQSTVASQQECDQLVTLFNSGQYAELESQSRSLLEQYPESGFVWMLLGASFRAQGKQAVPALQKAAEYLPDDAGVHSNLGVALKDLGRLDDAAASYRRALEINPDNDQIHYNLGNALKELGRCNDAVASYRRALEINPDYAEIHHNLGLALNDLGQFDVAVASYRRTLEINPKHANAHVNLGNALQNLGQLDDAAACFRHALAINPDYIEARLNLVQAGKVKIGDINMEALIAQDKSVRSGITSLANEQSVILHFALGKCYDDTGAPENAFPHFLEGCRLKRATFIYDPDQTTQLFAEIARNFDVAEIERLRGGGNPSQLPIFIVGMPRSGTTLIEQIIASHPEVHGAGELPDLIEVAKHKIARISFPQNLHLLDREQLTALGTEYLTRIQHRAPNVQRITDKMPQNFLALGLIHLMLPNAKIIHVNRNPVDTCLSCFTQPFTTEQKFTYDLHELGRYYVDYFRLMQHWRQVLPNGAFLDVQYEDIVADKEAQSRRIIEYCGLEWNEACLDFHTNQRAVHTASLVQVRQPIYKTSVERWRKYEKFLGPLLAALGDLAPK